MPNSYDAIIIGAGHNGLVCGTYLAKAGLKILVLERRHIIGGAAVTEEFSPGFRASIFSYVMSLLHPKVIRDLELMKFGIKILPANDVFCTIGADDYIIFSDDIKKTQEQFSRFSKKDGAIYPEFDAYINETANIVRRILLETPIDPTGHDYRTLKANLKFLWRYRKIGKNFYRLVDLMTMSADEYLSRWFESSINKAVLAYYCSIGTFASPKTPGSAYVIMHHIMGEHEGAGGWGFIEGGMGKISDAIAESGRRFGLEIKTNAEVKEVAVQNGRVTGLVTAEGEQFLAKTIISNASCKVLFQDLVGAEHLPAEFISEIESFRTFSTAFKLNIAAHEPPIPAAYDKHKCGIELPNYMHIGPDIEYLEQAYEDARNGWYSSKPFITMVVPTSVDKTLAPPGKTVINVFGGHAPYELKNASWDDERENFIKTVLSTIDEVMPKFSDQIIDMQVLLPADIERIINSPHGHIFHGELALDQLFFQRPASKYSDYRSPITGLYQCGASTHPGGGVSGIPGHNAAREILKDWKRM